MLSVSQGFAGFCVGGQGGVADADAGSSAGESLGQTGASGGTSGATPDSALIWRHSIVGGELRGYFVNS